jgi:hypothetical protein
VPEAVCLELGWPGNLHWKVRPSLSRALEIWSEANTVIKEECGALWREPDQVHPERPSLCSGQTPDPISSTVQFHSIARGPSEPTPSSNVDVMESTIRP